MTRPTAVDVAVLGAGPAGLACAHRCARAGCTTLLIDSNLHPGGQLVKQIHKFFGTREHGAGTRGVDIAAHLGRKALDSGALLWSDSYCHTITPSCRLEVLTGKLQHAGDAARMLNRSVQARRVVIATGAEENAVAFSGWTLPGVMGAGAAQTMINVHRVLPGRRVLMVGSGNVGLIVTHQLLQAGAGVAAVLEADVRIGGYAVHAAKIRRAGVPILTSHTIGAAHGDRGVEGATVVRLDEDFNVLTGGEVQLAVDTVCVAAGLRPSTRLAQLAGCELVFSDDLGGWTPVHDANLQTTNARVYVAGDACGVEEASTAMEEGRLAATAVVRDLGLLDEERAQREMGLVRARLNGLRGGPWGSHRMKAKAEVHARAGCLRQCVKGGPDDAG